MFILFKKLLEEILNNILVDFLNPSHSLSFLTLTRFLLQGILMQEAKRD